MSRRRKALITAVGTYAQSALSMAFSFLVTRALIHRLGESTYGLWLASGALLAYAGFAELGIFGILPWLVAEADGRKSPEEMRSLLANGVMLGAVIGLAYAAIALGLWALFPGVLHLSAADRGLLFGPLLAMIVATVLTYPLRVFSGLLAGLQDVTYTGTLGLVQTVLSNVLIVAFVLRGHGLYGLALGASVPPLLVSIVALWRTRLRWPELLRGWPKVHWSGARVLLSGGMAAWFSNIGWQLAFSTDSVIIASMHRRELVPMFAVTSRLGLTFMQLAWALPDAGLVGLAQLSAEGSKERVAEVVGVMLRLLLLLGGGIACVVLAVNAGFVGLWVGPSLFGGRTLNALFALDVLLLSVVHGLMVSIAVVGNRGRVGAITFANGLLHAALAVPLGRTFGLSGVAAATALSALLTSVPAGLRWLEPATGLSVRRWWRETIRPWALRFVPAAAAAAGIGSLYRGRHPAALALLGGAVGLACLWLMRPLYRSLPLGGRVQRLLLALRLL